MIKMATRGKLLSLALGGAVLLTACDEPTAPVGVAGEVTVRAYVDVDGDGSYGANDQGLEGFTVTLEQVDGDASHTATTDAEGAARFPGVEPGSYTAQWQGDAPAGALLSTPGDPVVVVPFQGGSIETELRFVFNPGELSGVLYRDDDESGDFTPGTDAPAPGVGVELYSGTEATGEPTAVTSTDGEGRFHFPRVRAGSATLVFDAPETIDIVGGSQQQVEVAPEAPTSVEVRFEGSLLIDIADARDRSDGAAVEVEGVVLADQGTYDFEGRDTYIQDGTGGVRLWALSGDEGLEVGDSVRVTGVMSTFNDERQLEVLTVTSLGTGTVPAPRPVSGEEINSFAFDGQLGVTTAVTVVGVQVFSFDAHNVTVEDEAGTQFIVRVDSPNEIPSEFW
ncbi:MAG: SdrD B-like domain-containing protein, partial [bacterium]